jgi:predicted alpha/beta superfamily hydrolase
MKRWRHFSLAAVPLVLGLTAGACSAPADGDERDRRAGLPAAEAPAAPAAPGPPATIDSPPRPLVVDRVELRDLTSRVNGVAYELRVALPHGYETPGRRFPVVYALDADYSFLIARNVTDHLSERDHLREVVVVAIGYRDQEPGRTASYRRNRTRDYTPTFVRDGGYGPEVQKLSGGGPKFLEALATEIVPFIDRHYRTDPGERVLVGHSYGGLFTVWTLLTRPGLFHRYVAVSPSLWYDDHLVARLEETFAADQDALPARLYLCVGSREHDSERSMVADLRQLAERLESRRYRGLALEARVLEDETHNSVFPACLSNGLRYVLEGR